jgi:hypothetical protein
MGKQAAGVLYVLVLVAVVVSVDVLFFRGRFWGRLMANVGIVLVFGAFDLRVLRQSMTSPIFRWITSPTRACGKGGR